MKGSIFLNGFQIRNKHEKIYNSGVSRVTFFIIVVGFIIIGLPFLFEIFLKIT